MTPPGVCPPLVHTSARPVRTEEMLLLAAGTGVAAKMSVPSLGFQPHPVTACSVPSVMAHASMRAGPHMSVSLRLAGHRPIFYAGSGAVETEGCTRSRSNCL